jgi:EmrB/QacA subfamily drug resistance transporter
MHPIGEAFHADVAAMQWVLDGYNLTYAVLLLTGGLLADLYGRRRTFQGGAAILAAASIICALAPSIGVLIGARVVTGAGAALLLPASLAIVRVVWPEQAARRRVLGVWASCNGLAFVVGPTIGGLLIQHLGWASVFLLSVPLALAALLLSALVIRESANPEGRHLDLRGQLAGAIVLGSLVFAAIDSDRDGHISMLSLSFSALAFPCFLVAERRAGAAALVPLELFRNSPFCGAIVATASMTFGIYGMIFLLPLVWQASGVLGPETAGLALLPCALVFFLVSQRSGHLAQRVGVRVLTAGGTALIGCGLLVLAVAHAGQPLALAAVGLALTGIGMGLNTGPLMSVAVEAVTAARSGTASALINVARMVGATLGVASLGAAFALGHGGASGLRAAMLVGGSVQLVGAMIAWATVR